MNAFMDENFLLTTPTARRLYHDFAEDMPILDYHCHLSPREIAENIRFRNLGHLMLGGDHYKWRGMSAYGFDNAFIRTSDDEARFMAFAQAMPMLIGNPLYHWTHLELRRVFGIDQILNADTAPEIWQAANRMLDTEDFRAQRLIERFRVTALCTTDDPVDDLAYHRQLRAQSDFKTLVLPAFRPDKAVNVELPGFRDYMARLSAAANLPVRGVEDVLAALEARVEFFHGMGCRLSDHALDVTPFAGPDMARANAAFRAAMAGETVDAADAAHYKTALLTALGRMYARRDWTQQYHMNALRNVNGAMFRRFGPDTGFDAINDAPIAQNLARLLDAQGEQLPRTILYALNPAANAILAAMAGCFQGGQPGKIQFGSAWWFCDQRDGMREQLKCLANIGMLGNFVGMLTDSRSFISYPRHEYFRRILCDLIGGWVEAGEYPNDGAALERIVRGICYDNARNYLKLF